MSEFKPGDRVIIGELYLPEVPEFGRLLHGVVMGVCEDVAFCVREDKTFQVLSDRGHIHQMLQRQLSPSTAPLPPWLAALVERETAALRERAERAEKQAHLWELSSTALRCALSERPAPEHWRAALTTRRTWSTETEWLAAVEAHASRLAAEVKP